VLTLAAFGRCGVLLVRHRISTRIRGWHEPTAIDARGRFRHRISV